MAGQVWATNELGGYMYSDNLSDILRMAMQPLLRFRQQCFVENAIGKHKGQYYNWNIYSKVKTKGRKLSENEKMPETNFTITQGQLQIDERGNSVPYTGLLNDVSAQPIEAIIHQTLKDDCNDVMEDAAYEQWNDTKLTVSPASGSSASDVTFENSGTPTITNDVGLGLAHVKIIIDEMKERNIPVFDGVNYGCMGRPSTFRPFKDDLEALSMYTQQGYYRMLNGEIGRSFDGARFFEHTSIDSEGWSNGKSDPAFFFGNDTVAEGVSIPEEIRGKLPGDYGRDRGVAWYALNGFGIVHNETGAEQNRIIKWASAG